MKINGEHMMASSIVKEVGAKVPHFINLNLYGYKCNKWIAFKAQYLDSTMQLDMASLLTKYFLYFAYWRVL